MGVDKKDEIKGGRFTLIKRVVVISAVIVLACYLIGVLVNEIVVATIISKHPYYVDVNITRDSQAVKANGFDSKGIPKNYYETARKIYKQPKKHDKETLDWILFNPHTQFPPYKRGVFDCSESAAYLEWILEGYGFNTKIASGSDGVEYHTWVVVYLDDGKAYDLEATELTKDARFHDDFIYRLGEVSRNDYNRDFRLYDSIYEMMAAGGLGEVDWWNYTETSFSTK